MAACLTLSSASAIAIRPAPRASAPCIRASAHTALRRASTDVDDFSTSASAGIAPVVWGSELAHGAALDCWPVVLQQGRQAGRGHRLPRELETARVLNFRLVWISVSQIAQVLLNGTDLLIIAGLLGPTAVVPYACTGKLVSLLANQAQLFMQMALPALSECA